MLIHLLTVFTGAVSNRKEFGTEAEETADESFHLAPTRLAEKSSLKNPRQYLGDFRGELVLELLLKRELPNLSRFASQALRFLQGLLIENPKIIRVKLKVMLEIEA